MRYLSRPTWSVYCEGYFPWPRVELTVECDGKTNRVHEVLINARWCADGEGVSEAAEHPCGVRVHPDGGGCCGLHILQAWFGRRTLFS